VFIRDGIDTTLSPSAGEGFSAAHRANWRSLHDLKTNIAANYPEAIDTADDVFNGPMILVFDQAENRLHSIRAMMRATFDWLQ